MKYVILSAVAAAGVFAFSWDKPAPLPIVADPPAVCELAGASAEEFLQAYGEAKFAIDYHRDHVGGKLPEHYHWTLDCNSKYSWDINVEGVKKHYEGR
jgi:hypothetical protein